MRRFLVLLLFPVTLFADDAKEKKIRGLVSNLVESLKDDPKALEKAMGDAMITFQNALIAERAKNKELADQLLEANKLIDKQTSEKMDLVGKQMKSMSERMASDNIRDFQTTAYNLRNMATIALSGVKLAKEVSKNGGAEKKSEAFENAVWNGLWFVCMFEPDGRSKLKFLPKDQKAKVDQFALKSWIETEEISDEIVKMAQEIGLSPEAEERWGAAIKARAILRADNGAEEKKAK